MTIRVDPTFDARGNLASAAKFKMQSGFEIVVRTSTMYVATGHRGTVISAAAAPLLYTKSPSWPDGRETLIIEPPTAEANGQRYA